MIQFQGSFISLLQPKNRCERISPWKMQMKLHEPQVPDFAVDPQKKAAYFLSPIVVSTSEHMTQVRIE